MNKFATRAARPLEILLAIIFLAAAILKVYYDTNTFVGQIMLYRVIESNAALAVTALVTLFAETFLGVAMLLGLRLKLLVLWLVQAMLIFFSVLIVYAWQVHDLKDCGCFGGIPMTPLQSLAKNGVMVLMAGVAIVGFTREPRPMKAAGVKFLVALVLGIVMSVYGAMQINWQEVFPASKLSVVTPAPPTANTGQTDAPKTVTPTSTEAPAIPPPPPNAAGKFAFVVTTAEGDTDLSKGDHLVVLLSMTCDHCMEAVPTLNGYVGDPGLPPLVALGQEPEAGSMDTFVAQTSPLFPMMSIGNDMMKMNTLLEDANAPPRLVYVRDGASVKGWMEPLPAADVLAADLTAAGYVPGQ